MAATVQTAVYKMGLDSSSYEQAAARVDQANQKMVASTEGVAVAEEKLTRANRTTADGFSRLEARYDPLIRLEMQRNAELQKATRYLDQGKVANDRYVAQVERVNRAFDQQIAQLGRVRTAYGSVGNAFQQAGFQLGDFAVQVASGQGVIRPLIQQGTQIVQAFGPWGAVLGAAGAVVGALAVAFLDLGESTEDTKKALEDYNKAIDDYLDLTADEETRTRRRTEQRILETQGILAQKIATRDLTIAELELRRARQEELEAAAAASSTPGIPSQLPGLDRRIAQLRDANAGDQQRIDLLQLKSELDDYFKTVEDGLKRQAGLTKEISDLERDSSDRRTKDAKEAADLAKKAGEERLKAAKAQQDELNRWLDGQQEALKAQGEQVKADTDRTRAQIAANDNLQDYIRKLEDAATLDGKSAVDKKVQQAILEAQNKLLDKQGDKLGELEESDKRRIETAIRQADAYEEQRKAAEKHAREIERIAERAEDQLSDALGDTFFDYLTGKTTSFWQTFKNLGLRAIADIAASSVAGLFRPAISGITSFIMGGSSPAAGVSGGGMIAGTANGGSGSLLNLASLGSNFLPSGWFDGISSSINAFGASYLGLSGAGAAQAAASTYGISAGQAAALSNSGALGSTASLSGILGAAGLGFAGGSLLASLTGGNAVGGGIGGGIGAGAGFLIGGPVGAVIGGLGGSLLGGLFGGGKKKFAGGHTSIGVDPETGLLFVGSTGARGVDPNVTIGQANQATEQINAFLQAYGIRATRGGDIVQGDATGGASSAAAFVAQMVTRRNFTSDDPVFSQILGASKAKDLQGLAADLDFGKLYKTMSELQRPVNQLRDGFEAMSKQFDEATKKAGELGLSVSKLREGTAANFNQEIERAILGFTNPLKLALDDFAEVADARLAYAKKIGADLVEVERLNNLERLQVLQQSGADLNSWLRNQILGPTSSLAPGGRFDEAQKQFGAAVSAARAGTGGIGDVTRLADIVLAMSTDLYGGTKQAAVIEQMVRSTISTLGRELGFPGFAEGGYHSGGLRIVGERGWEVEATGPARYWNQQQIGQALTSSSGPSDADRAVVRAMRELVSEVQALRSQNAQIVEDNRSLKSQLSRLLSKAA